VNLRHTRYLRNAPEQIGYHNCLDYNRLRDYEDQVYRVNLDKLKNSDPAKKQALNANEPYVGNQPFGRGEINQAYCKHYYKVYHHRSKD